MSSGNGIGLSGSIFWFMNELVGKSNLVPSSINILLVVGLFFQYKNPFNFSKIFSLILLIISVLYLFTKLVWYGKWSNCEKLDKSKHICEYNSNGPKLDSSFNLDDRNSFSGFKFHLPSSSSSSSIYGFIDIISAFIATILSIILLL